VFSFQADLKERRKINRRLLMAEKNKAKQAGFGMTDTHELQSTRSDVQQAAGAIAGEYSGKVNQIWDDARDRVRTFQEDADKYVRANPTKTVFTALGIGFVLGLIFRR
jgi:ElaB/YqjD/DUF883 family membrane-anchored ribosome-binding protein